MCIRYKYSKRLSGKNYYEYFESIPKMRKGSEIRKFAKGVTTCRQMSYRVCENIFHVKYKEI